MWTTFKLREDLRVGLPRDVGQNIEPAPVSHTNRDFVETSVGCVGQYRVEERY